MINLCPRLTLFDLRHPYHYLMHSWTLLLGSKYNVYIIYILLRASADNSYVISVMFHVVSVSVIYSTDLLHPNIHGNFVWIVIEITINLKGLDYY